MKVLLAVEGSEFSKAAIDEACRLFGDSGDVELKIVSAVAPAYLAAEPFAVSAGFTGEMIAAAQGAAEQIVSKAEAEIRGMLPSVKEISTKVSLGPAAKVIIEEANQWGADMIILGSHGYGFWQRSLLGSVSNSVVHHANCSVLVVRPDQNG